MCGRYNFTIEQSEEIKNILEKFNAKSDKSEIKRGEVFPTNRMPILIEKNQEISPVLSIWGFPGYDRKGVIINARAETALEKRMFRDSLLNRRCIILSTGFYEWDGRKQKFLFRQEGSSTVYMAGVYQYDQEEMRFVILTTGANESVREVHSRMPLVIPKSEVEAWILDGGASREFLMRTPPQLVRKAVG
jgi:putative SOS response-associated peptidase YedK